MPKRSESAADLDDADLDYVDGGVPMLLPAVQSVPEPLFSTANTPAASGSGAQTVKPEHLAEHVLQSHKR